jgi:hypothetical protein
MKSVNKINCALGDFMKNIKNVSEEKNLNDTMKPEQILQRACKNCGFIRKFKTIVGYRRSINTLCKSCNNSKKAGFDRISRVIDGVKECLDCKKTLPVSEFVAYKNGGLHSLCKICKRERFKKYQKSYGRFKKYKLTLSDYEVMYESQSGKCYICNSHEKILHIDHNHTTNVVRKLLCKKCNLAIGLAGENIEVLKNMITYLENH